MRISDGSSDLCSSDLAEARGRAVPGADGAEPGHRVLLALTRCRGAPAPDRTAGPRAGRLRCWVPPSPLHPYPVGARERPAPAAARRSSPSAGRPGTYRLSVFRAGDILRCKGMCSGGVPAAAPPSRKERRMSAAMAVAPVLVDQGIQLGRAGRLEAADGLYGHALSRNGAG